MAPPKNPRLRVALIKQQIIRAQDDILHTLQVIQYGKGRNLTKRVIMRRVTAGGVDIDDMAAAYSGYD
jgi:hypothetical protein